MRIDELWLPGTVFPPDVGEFGRGKIFAVAVPGNPHPLAIGEAEMSSAGVSSAGGKGKFLAGPSTISRTSYSLNLRLG